MKSCFKLLSERFNAMRMRKNFSKLVGKSKDLRR